VLDRRRAQDAGRKLAILALHCSRPERTDFWTH
jgi:hypothetical protein